MFYATALGQLFYVTALGQLYYVTAFGQLFYVTALRQLFYMIAPLRQLFYVIAPLRQLCDCSKCARAAGYSVVLEFCGHGIGSYFHGPPDIVHVGEFSSSG